MWAGFRRLGGGLGGFVVGAGGFVVGLFGAGAVGCGFCFLFGCCDMVLSGLWVSLWVIVGDLVWWGVCVGCGCLWVVLGFAV